jgi:hypothetical protein
MQNAYASGQLTQLMGRFSLASAEGVHVEKPPGNPGHERLKVVGAMPALSDVIQPGS